MDQQLGNFVAIGVGVIVIVLFSFASYKFRKRLDPYKKIRQEIARQAGLTIVPMRGDPFALKGFMANRLASVSTMPFSRSRVKKYEISAENPEKLKLSFQSRNNPSSFARFANLPATNLDASIRPFFEQFEIYGKFSSFAFKIAENEVLQETLLKLSQYTRAVKFTVRKDRIVCYESGFGMTSSDADEVIIGYLIFKILVEISNLVENPPIKNP